ncbi:hypothetical protein EBU71_16420 [bacterium]|nr:hypothetical protein [Candidatus Elulimicrobium humile]
MDEEKNFEVKYDVFNAPYTLTEFGPKYTNERDRTRYILYSRYKHLLELVCELLEVTSHPAKCKQWKVIQDDCPHYIDHNGILVDSYYDEIYNLHEYQSEPSHPLYKLFRDNQPTMERIEYVFHSMIPPETPLPIIERAKHRQKILKNLSKWSPFREYYGHRGQFDLWWPECYSLSQQYGLFSPEEIEPEEIEDYMDQSLWVIHRRYLESQILNLQDLTYAEKMDIINRSTYLYDDDDEPGVFEEHLQQLIQHVIDTRPLRSQLVDEGFDADQIQHRLNREMDRELQDALHRSLYDTSMKVLIPLEAAPIDFLQAPATSDELCPVCGEPLHKWGFPVASLDEFHSAHPWCVRNLNRMNITKCPTCRGDLIQTGVESNVNCIICIEQIDGPKKDYLDICGNFHYAHLDCAKKYFGNPRVKNKKVCPRCVRATRRTSLDSSFTRTPRFAEWHIPYAMEHLKTFEPLQKGKRVSSLKRRNSQSS